MTFAQAGKVAVYGLLALLIASCTGSRAPKPVAPGGPITGPVDYSRPHRDGAPWWDVDVSRIPDAVPMPHYGRVKANSYTVMGKTYYPMNDARRYQVSGVASWYGTKFHGQATANGEAYDLYGMTAAHKTLPLPSYVRVTHLDSGESVVVRVNDRGPFHDGRIIDLSYAAAVKLGLDRSGTAKVEVQALVPGADAPRLAANTPAAPLPASAPLPGPAVQVADDGRRRILQVGAYRERDNARRIARMIEDAGIRDVEVASVKLNCDKLWRVRIGPLAADAATQVIEHLRSRGLPSPRVFIE